MNSPRPRRRAPFALLGAALFAACAAAPLLRAADWPMWGGTPARNMVSTSEHNLPASADLGKARDSGDDGRIDLSTTKNVKWAAKLGNQTYGNPTVAGGRVFVGTNNGSPRDPKYQGDYGIVMCFEEATGKFLWQLAVPKLAGGKNVDWDEVGVCSSPTVDGDRVYIVTNRCEVLCLAAGGMSGANKGPFQDEAQYTAGPGKPPIPQGPGDADILWRYDMRHELGVVPHFQTSSSVLVVGERLYVTTSNAVDWTDKHTPAPDAPALICLDKKTGRLVGQERSGISARTLYSNWSSPAFGNVAGKPTVVFGGGDGFCYGFDPEPKSPDLTGVGTLKELWRIDCNPPERRVRDGKPLKYRDPNGPSEIIATPVVVNDRVYVPTGQDPEHGNGVGCLNCIAGKDGKVDVLWRYLKINRSMSNAAVADGLLFIADSAGMIHCLDPETGNPFWTHDTEAAVWASTLVADGKVYLGNESGEVHVLAASKVKKLLGKMDFGGSVYSTPVPANGVLYVATGTHLWALQQK